MAYSNIKDLDDAFNKLAGVNLIHYIQKYNSFKYYIYHQIVFMQHYLNFLQGAPEGITLAKYQELYAGFIANENAAGADLPCLYLFGPLSEI